MRNTKKGKSSHITGVEIIPPLPHWNLAMGMLRDAWETFPAGGFRALTAFQQFEHNLGLGYSSA